MKILLYSLYNVLLRLKFTPSGIRTRGPNRVKVMSEPTRPSEQCIELRKNLRFFITN
jgi:hypothetical protein